MPFLFTWRFTTLAQVRVHLQEGELLFAYLDDVYVVSKPDRTIVLHDSLADKLHTMAATKGKFAGGMLPDTGDGRVGG